MSKLDNAERAINELFSDTSVAPADTLNKLEILQELIDSLIDALKETANAGE